MLTKKALRELKHDSQSDLQKAVITDLLSQGAEDEVLIYMKDVVNHGCVSGTVSMLVYYSDTEAFFKKYFNEIFELLNEYKEEIGEYPNIEFNANNLSWFAYEKIVYDLLNEFEEEF
jgi:hypothetical protein